MNWTFSDHDIFPPGHFSTRTIFNPDNFQPRQFSAWTIFDLDNFELDNCRPVNIYRQPSFRSSHFKSWSSLFLISSQLSQFSQLSQISQTNQHRKFGQFCQLSQFSQPSQSSQLSLSGCKGCSLNCVFQRNRLLAQQISFEIISPTNIHLTARAWKQNVSGM